MDSLICFSHLRWDFVWQRPQQLLSRLGAHFRVVFVEEPIASPHLSEPQLDIRRCDGITVIRLLQPTEHQFWIGHGDPLTQDTYCRLLCDYLEAEEHFNPLLWLYTPMALDFVADIPHSALIIDVMDQLAAFAGAPIELIEREKQALRQADIVFAGGASLYRDKLPYNPHTYLFPSGVNIEHFRTAAAPSDLPIPEELANLSGPILGYYGVIDERIDLSLIAHLATAHPEWQIVLVGPVLKIDPNSLPHAANIHYLGMKSYSYLPAYLATFDVALIPFALNEATHFVSPTKTLEYIAARKAVVSTPIHDVIELYGNMVRIGNDPIAFEREIQVALLAQNDQDLIPANKRMDDLLAQNTWDHIADAMHAIIQQGLASTPVNSL